MSKILLLITVAILTGFVTLTAFAYQPLLQSTESPRVVAAVAPIYPPIAAAARAMSDVIVEVKIDPAGNVSSAEAVSGHPLLQQAAKMAANRWKFEPAAAKSASRTAKLQFVFRIADKKLPASEATPVFMPPYKVEITHNPPVIDNSKSY